MNQTKIEWTDYSWNPVTGCKHDCSYCYGRAMNHRFNRSWEPTFHEKRLNQPYHIKGPQRIFVCSMADLFGDWVPDHWIEAIFNIIEKCPNHIFQFLSKNPKRYLKCDFPSNSWLGVSATDQEMYDNAINVLARIDGYIKFISCEPLLGEIEMHGNVDWTIIGAGSYPQRSQPRREWVKNMIDYSQENKIPVFLKPNLQVIDHTLFKEFPVRIDIKSTEVQSTLI